MSMVFLYDYENLNYTIKYYYLNINGELVEIDNDYVNRQRGKQ